LWRRPRPKLGCGAKERRKKKKKSSIKRNVIVYTIHLVLLLKFGGYAARTRKKYAALVRNQWKSINWKAHMQKMRQR
jgi:hypothetical protein